MQPNYEEYLNNHPVYQHIKELRGEDRFHDDVDSINILRLFFPATVKELVLGLSDITSTFYGLLLSETAKRYGNDGINAISQSAVFEIGRRKAEQALVIDPAIPRDACGICNVFISAIYVSSPEYKINVTTYQSDEVTLILTGTDRYHRSAQMLNLTEHITWPILTPFFYGVCSAWHISYQADLHVKELDEHSRCRYNIHITRK